MRERAARLPDRLVGRRAEATAVEHALAGGRVVTIVGPAGEGTTAVAVAVVDRSAAVAERFPDGAWFCDLAAHADAEGIVLAIAAELGVLAGEDAPVHRAVESALRARRGLLILDHADHVASDCFRVVRRLVDQCPGLGIVVTSIEPLHFPGEEVVELAPLDRGVRDDDGAVALFVERAVAADPGFDAPVHLADVTAVVAAVEGVPLALELVASRVGEQRFDDLAASLVDTVGDPAGDRVGDAAGAGGRPPPSDDERRRRRRSILGPVVDWSLDLRPTAAPLLFERLSVFRSGFDEPAARAVMAGVTGGRQVPWLIAELVQDGLVEPLGPSRYRIAEAVRRHADVRLGLRGDRVDVRNRHLQHVIGVVDRAAETCAVGDWPAAWEMLEPVWADVGAAIGWATDCKRGRDVDRLLGDLVVAARWSWSPDLAAWARRALERAGSIGLELGAPSHLHVAAARSREGDHRAALEAALAALDLASTPSVRAWARYDAAFALLHLGRTAEAAAMADRMTARPSSAPAEDAPRRSAHAIFKLHARQMQLADAFAEIDRAAEVAREAAHPLAVAQVEFDRAVAGLAGGDGPSAVEGLQRAFELAQEQRASGLAARVLAALSAVPGDDGLGVVARVLDAWTQRPDPGNEWVVLDAAALGLAAAGLAEPAAILLGHLEPDERAPATGAKRRAAVAREVDAHRRGRTWRARGRDLDRRSALGLAAEAVRSARADR